MQSDVLAGSTVCFLSHGSHNKDKLERIVHQLGGRVFMNLTPTTTYAFATDLDSYKVKSAIQKTGVDIISVDWLLECSAFGRRMALKPKHFVYMAPQVGLKYGDVRFDFAFYPYPCPSPIRHAAQFLTIECSFENLRNMPGQQLIDVSIGGSHVMKTT